MTPDAHAAQNEIAKPISLTAYKGTVVIADFLGDVVRSMQDRTIEMPGLKSSQTNTRAGDL